MVIENFPTPEMVRRHLITEAAEIDFENSYDSDKVMGPFLDAIDEEGAQLIEEVEVPEKSSVEEDVEKATATVLPSVVPIGMTENTVKKLKIRAQSTVGKKAELVERLLKTLTDNVPLSVNVAISRSRVKKKNDVLKSNVGRGFPPTARWRPLVPDGVTQ